MYYDEVSEVVEILRCGREGMSFVMRRLVFKFFYLLDMLF